MSQPSVEKLYSQIEQLTTQAAELISENNVERVVEILTTRLSLFKQLAGLVDKDSQSQKQFEQFLIHCQQLDNKQVAILHDERLKVLAAGKKQNRINQAVNAYQLVDKC